MLSSKRWITSKEIKDSLDISNLELLDWIKGGLQVYDRHGWPTGYHKLSLSHPGGQAVNLSRTGPPARYVARMVDVHGNRLANLDESMFLTKEVESFCLENGILSGQASDKITIITPQGTKWENIFIRVPNINYLEIKYPGDMKNIEAQEIFSGYGQDGGKLWHMFLLLVARGGELPSGQKQHVSRLRAKLKQVLPDIQGDPLKYIKSKKVYKAQFNVSGDMKEILGDNFPDT